MGIVCAAKMNLMIEWIYFPKSHCAPEIICKVVEAFAHVAHEIDSHKYDLISNDVLAKVSPGLQALGFKVERSKKSNEKISVPVLFGRNGKPEKSFDADAYHESEKIVVEVEAGRGVVNNQFLKDLFQASMMHDVNYCGIAVRKTYKRSADFEYVVTFLETLYSSNRLQLPLQGVLVIGY